MGRLNNRVSMKVEEELLRGYDPERSEKDDPNGQVIFEYGNRWQEK